MEVSELRCHVITTLLIFTMCLWQAMASETNDRRQVSAQLHRQIVELKERAKMRLNVYKVRFEISISYDKCH